MMLEDKFSALITYAVWVDNPTAKARFLDLVAEIEEECCGKSSRVGTKEDLSKAIDQLQKLIKGRFPKKDP